MPEINYFLFRFINGTLTHPVLDICAVFLSLINAYGLVWLVLLGVLAAFGGTTGRRAALSGLIALVVGVVSSEVLKNLVMQPRPFLALPDVRLLVVGPPSSYSFPSVNVAYAFAASSGASLATRRLLGRIPAWGWASLALATAITYSRVYVGVHYPSDALVGALLGVFGGWLATLLVTKFGKLEALGGSANTR
jgi:undecaprenyl-diphosphatase